MKKQMRLIFFTFSLLFTTSCYQEDFLKDELLSNNSVDFLYSSSDSIANAVVGLYSLIGSLTNVIGLMERFHLYFRPKVILLRI